MPFSAKTQMVFFLEEEVKKSLAAYFHSPLEYDLVS